MSVQYDIMLALHDWLVQQGVDATVNATYRKGKFSLGGVPNVSIQSRRIRLGIVNQEVQCHQCIGPNHTLLCRVELCSPTMCEQLLNTIKSAPVLTNDG